MNLSSLSSQLNMSIQDLSAFAKASADIGENFIALL